MPKVINERRQSVLDQQMADHDIIIKLDTKVDILTKKVDEIASNTVSRVDTLEKQQAEWAELAKLRTQTLNDHESRIRFLEKYAWGAIAIIGVLNFVGFGGLILLALKLLHK